MRALRSTRRTTPPDAARRVGRRRKASRRSTFTRQGDEAHRYQVAGGELAVLVLFDQQEILRPRRLADRYRHPAARLELRDQRRRHVSSSGGDNDSVVRRGAFHAEITVSVQHGDVAVTKSLEAFGSGLCERLDDFDTDDLLCELRENRRLIA